MSDNQLQHYHTLHSTLHSLELATSTENGSNLDELFMFQRTDAEWRSLFDDVTYQILRHGYMEWPKTSELWDVYRPGEFQCKGCELLVYESQSRVKIATGWLYFKKSMPNATLQVKRGENTENICRCCGSHLGQLVVNEYELLHCINGKALNFLPS